MSATCASATRRQPRTGLALRCAAHAAPLSLGDWRSHTAQALDEGQRLLSLFGWRVDPHADSDVLLTAVLLEPQGLRLLHGCARAAAHYPALTVQHPCAQIFERELWEQTGLVPEGHPWLKPVRFEGARQGDCGSYPFFSVRGAEVHEVGVGPIHAGVIEPGHFRFMCHGETVHHLEIQLGYQHRGVEALLLRQPPRRLGALVESIVGDSVIAYASAFHAALEQLSLQSMPTAVHASRAIALELERIAMHLATLAGMTTDIAHQQSAATYQRLRTAVINATQRVCGNRFGRGWIRTGSAAPINATLRADLSHMLQAFLRDFVQVNTLVCGSRSVRARLKGMGCVPTQVATDLGLTGVVARASGVVLDLRDALANGATPPYPPVTETTGDCWARMVVRMREAQASAEWLLQQLANPELDLDGPAPLGTGADAGSAIGSSGLARPLAPHTLGLSVIEGVRGPVLVALQTDHAGQLVHAKVQDPSLANWFGLAQALRGQQISDFPICNKSFDLSYCGNDL
ncbi:MAG: NADH-quinone oxidoreductase subunit C [Burkholderiales bacterium]|nr:NADH-quinone oxidoreductase subunit C [Burkholderiales bacterium]